MNGTESAAFGTGSNCKVRGFTTVDFPGAAGTDVGGIDDLERIVGDYVDRSGVQHGFLAEEVVESWDSTQTVMVMLARSKPGPPATQLRPSRKSDDEVDELSNTKTRSSNF